MVKSRTHEVLFYLVLSSRGEVCFTIYDSHALQLNVTLSAAHAVFIASPLDIATA